MGIVKDLRMTVSTSMAFPTSSFRPIKIPANSEPGVAHVSARGRSNHRFGMKSRAWIPAYPYLMLSSMNDILDRSLASRRFSAELVGGFAGLALLLATIGIYGLLAYMVSQRSREIGIRMALGAGRGGILKLFLRKGIVLAGLGIVAGMVVSASTASLMGSLLYGVRRMIPLCL